ncbi:MAG: M13 family metallopeptidase [Atopobiaceae bacterium]|nr:M13 family metallopeptidase [Atopobiaceae bacterium]
MNKTFRKLLVTVLSCLLLVGCSSPSGVTIDPSDAARDQLADSSGPAGSPWNDWFIYGVLTEQDEVRPQDDFFTAINKDWILEQTDEDYLEWSVVDEREYQIKDQMIGLFEGDAPEGEQYGHDLDNLKVMYDLAGDWDGRDRDGVRPVKAIVERLQAIKSLDEFTDWLCSDDYRLSQCWEASEDGKILGVGLYCLLPYVQEPGFGSGEDGPVRDDIPEDGYVVEIDPPSMELAPYLSEADALEEESDVDAFRKASDNAEIAYNLMLYIGLDEDEAADVLNDAMTLESLMEDGCSQESDYEDGEWLTFDELSQRKRFPLARIARAYGYGDASAYILYDPAWLKTMGDLYNEDNLHLFTSHALVGVLLDSAMMLDTQAYNFVANAGSWADDELESDVEQVEEEGSDESANEGETLNDEELDQWFKRDACKIAADALPVSYAKLYIEHFYGETTNDDVLEMTNDVLREYERMLQEEDWMSQETRDAAVAKLKAMKIQVGYPSTWQDTSAIEVQSRANGATLYDEVRKLRAVRLEKGLAALRDSDAASLWTSCMDVNAFYLAETNSVTIGAGILGGVYWPENGSYEERLAATGMTIGHEFSHAFDSYGANFDESGTYRNWWTDEDWDTFDQRVARVKKALSEIDPLGSGGYDGEQVCDECMADLGGLKVIMRLASQRPDFDYDKFFRAYARSWASVMTYDTAHNQLETDGHPLDRDRVNIPLREFDKFYETYGIKEGDGMWLDPKDRISVW